MKLNFRDWSIIVEALKDKAESCKSNLHYWSDEESEEYKRYNRELTTVQNLIDKIEGFSI